MAAHALEAAPWVAHLLNPWQRGFPLVARPFAHIAAQLPPGSGLALDEAGVRAAYARLRQGGALSRIGGVFAPGAGGASTLAAMAVPAARLEAVAAQVSALPGVNHNYEREPPGGHGPNLWFVMTGADAPSVEASLHQLEADTRLPVLRLPMRRAYRIDLGFDLAGRVASDGPPAAPRRASPRARPLDATERALASLVEDGLPLLERPYAAWAEALAWPETEVRQHLQRWLDEGVLRRFGAIVRHHELGFSANAMTVFKVPDTELDACGHALAAQPGVTLAYARAPAPGWPYNLYCMVHGRDRPAVADVLARVRPACGLAAHPHAVLFSRRRFKQIGASRFRPTAAPLSTAPSLPC